MIVCATEDVRAAPWDTREKKWKRHIVRRCASKREERETIASRCVNRLRGRRAERGVYDVWGENS